MPDVNMQPLRDLLATHPEECAAVVAMMATSSVCTVQEMAIRSTHHPPAITPARIYETALALEVAGLVVRGRRSLDNEITCMIVGDGDYAVARMGAAAWLREKCPRTDKHRGFDLSNARLHEIAAEAMRSAVSEDDRAAAYKVRAVADGAVPFAAIDYRGCLMAMVARGSRLDVDAEVRAVWGETAKEDGEQR